MSILKGNLLYGQSGGPTSVINASAYGVIKEAQKHPDIIEDVICMRHGIYGALKEDFIFISKEDPEQIELLKHTPGSAFGSVRYKLKDHREDDLDYVRLLYIFRKYNIRYFIYNGGNDSMDTCHKIAEYLSQVDYECYVIGVPKTIDNDLPITDHTPGFGSAAKYVINTMLEISYDMLAYPKGKVTIVEIMGRHAGWLTASSALASLYGYGPDLIYLPETCFDLKKFKEDVSRIYSAKKQCLVAVSEGIHDQFGEYISSSTGLKDAFGHSQLGGVSTKLASIIISDLGIASRDIAFGTTQRAGAHLQSLTDVTEAIEVGSVAVRALCEKKTGLMVVILRKDTEEYEVEYDLKPLRLCANVEKKIPREWINEEGNQVNENLIKYILPLINGEHPAVYKDGIQQFTQFGFKWEE